METSAQLLKKIEKQLGIGGCIWFLAGIANAIGKWLDIDILKTSQRDGALGWWILTALLISGFFVLECLKAIVAAIQENASRSRD